MQNLFLQPSMTIILSWLALEVLNTSIYFHSPPVRLCKRFSNFHPSRYTFHFHCQQPFQNHLQFPFTTFTSRYPLETFFNANNAAALSFGILLLDSKLRFLPVIFLVSTPFGLIFKRAFIPDVVFSYYLQSALRCSVGHLRIFTIVISYFEYQSDLFIITRTPTSGLFSCSKSQLSSLWSISRSLKRLLILPVPIILMHCKRNFHKCFTIWHPLNWIKRNNHPRYVWFVDVLSNSGLK